MKVSFGVSTIARTSGYVLAATALSAGLALPASAETPATATKALTISGTVDNVNGHAEPGAAVELYAWPSSTVLRQLHNGRTVPITMLGSTKTTANGHYRVSVASLSALQSTAVVDDGIVNLEVAATAPGKYGSFSFSRGVHQTGHGVTLTKANPGGTSGPEVVTIHLAATNKAAVSKQGVPCGWTLLKTYKPRWTVLEGSYSVTAGTTQRFSYSQDSSSNLGVGQSNSGKKGSFTEQGTNSSSSTSGEDFAKHGGKTSVRYETKFIHAEYAYSCSHGYLSYQISTTGFAGGAKSVKTTAPKATYCVYQQAGSTYRKSKTAAFIFSAGYTIPVVDVSLSAQTGYDVEAKLSYHFSRDGRACGTNAYPGQTPKRVVARGN